MKVELIEYPRKEFKPITIQLTLESAAELSVVKSIASLNGSIPGMIATDGGDFVSARKVLEGIHDKVCDL